MLKILELSLKDSLNISGYSSLLLTNRIIVAGNNQFINNLLSFINCPKLSFIFRPELKIGIIAVLIEFASINDNGNSLAPYLNKANFSWPK
jgi:hypothetical protein